MYQFGRELARQLGHLRAVTHRAEKRTRDAELPAACIAQRATPFAENSRSRDARLFARNHAGAKSNIANAIKRVKRFPESCREREREREREKERVCVIDPELAAKFHAKLGSSEYAWLLGLANSRVTASYSTSDRSTAHFYIKRFTRRDRVPRASPGASPRGISCRGDPRCSRANIRVT